MQAPSSHGEVPSPETLLARAETLSTVLQQRAPEASELRRLPDQTVADIQAAGLFRVLQPVRFGGYEHDPSVFFDIQMALARGCPSTAWVYGVVGVHAWQLALFDDRAQQDVWAEDDSVLIGSSYAPTGKVKAVEGGYEISGRWSFSSGCDHCNWSFLGGFVPTEKGPPDMRTFLLPRSDYVIEDNWHVMGLRATGSKDIVVDGTFVPEHRTHRMRDGFMSHSPGNEVNTAPLFRLPFGQLFVRGVSTGAIGMAQGALQVYRDLAAKRVAAGDGAKVADDPNAQMVAAQAAALTDEARTLLHHNMGHLMTMVRAGESIPLDLRIRYRYDSSNAVVKCVEAIDLLFTASGGRAIFEDHPLLRYFLDVHAARAHFANSPDKPGWNYGSTQLGLKNKDFFL